MWAPARACSQSQPRAWDMSPCLRLDHERESVHAARENATVNAVQLETRRFELRTQALPWIGDEGLPRAPLVVLANLLRPLLLGSRSACPRRPRT